MSLLWTVRGPDRGHGRPAARHDAGGHRRHLDRQPQPCSRATPSSPSRARRSTAMISPPPRSGRRRRAGRRRRQAAGARAADGADDRRAGRAGGAGEGSGSRRARARRRRSSRSPARSARPPPRKRCATCCRAVGKVHASDKSFNNHWGVPLTLARMPEDCDYGVFEIGMNHAGEIRPLVKMVRPHVAIVTLIAAGASRPFQAISTRSPRPRPRSSKGSSRTAQRCSTATTRAGSFSKSCARAPASSTSYGFGEHRHGRLQAGEVRRSQPITRRSPPRSAATRSTCQDRRAGPPHRPECAGRARRRAAGRRRHRQGRRWRLPTLRPESGRGERHELRIAERHVHADRRELQCQSGLDEGGDRAARARRPCRRRAAHRRARRHAGARRPCGQAACRACRCSSSAADIDIVCSPARR